MAGNAILAPEGIDSLVTATEAATLCGTKTQTISMWVKRGKLAPTGLDERGRKVYRLLDVAKAERATRERARR
ncbi:helix-turn-helix domain-containing protein [Rhodococcus cerastii]|nr:helix-turn-helix domain-containing protein [Rhodococcus cerastii]